MGDVFPSIANRGVEVDLTMSRSLDKYEEAAYMTPSLCSGIDRVFMVFINKKTDNSNENA